MLSSGARKKQFTHGFFPLRSDNIYAMAVFQSVFNFFLPNQRRRPSSAGGGGSKSDPALGKVLDGIDDVLEGLNAPARVGEFIKSDIEDAFTAKSAKRPGYAPGVPAPVKIGLPELISDPFRTTAKVVGATFKTEWKDLVPIADVVKEEIDAGTWNYLYNRVWVAPDGTSLVPESTQQAIKRWNSRKSTGVDALRRLSAKGVEENPGLILLMGRELQRYAASAGFPPTVAGYRFEDILKDAEWQEGVLARTLAEATKLEKAGNFRRANDLWAYADKVQEDFKRSSEPYRAELIRQFDALVRKGAPLADTPAGQFWRYWKARNIHYATLNFLKVYRKDGVWGVVKVYGWSRVKEFVRYSKAADWISARVLSPLGLNKVAQALFDAQQAFKRLRNKLTRDVLKKLIEKIGLKRILAWIGGVLGSEVPVIGNALGAALGAMVQFVAEDVLSKLGGIFKIVVYALVGAFAVFVLGAIAIVTFISIILSNTPYPWETVATELDCDQTATATDACVLPLEVVKGVADNWGPGVNPGENHVEECYHDVIAKAKAAGVRPDFAMAIWLNESNASNYALYERLGEPPQDFGVPALAGKGFTAQITGFLNYIASHPFNPSYSRCFDQFPLMEAFMIIYRVGNCDSDEAIALGRQYLANIRDGAFRFVSRCSWPDYPMRISR